MILHGKDYAKWDRIVGWWVCDCGADLPGVWPEESLVVECLMCGTRWEYGEWPLNRFPGDELLSGFQPRRVPGKRRKRRREGDR